MKQTIIFNEKTIEELEKDIPSFINWDGILPTIEKMCRVRSDEVINGLVISDEGIEVKIGSGKPVNL
jgi:hypothetical protein